MQLVGEQRREHGFGSRAPSTKSQVPNAKLPQFTIPPRPGAPLRRRKPSSSAAFYKMQASGRPSKIGDSVGYPSVNRSSGCKPPAASSKSQSPNPKLHTPPIRNSTFIIHHSTFPIIRPRSSVFCLSSFTPCPGALLRRRQSCSSAANQI